MVTGIYQTTLGTHNHRSQRRTGKGGGNENYYDSFELPVKSVPDLLRSAGYYVTNERKEDYNFIASDLYDGEDWSERNQDQPFFAQLQLSGGKARGAKVANPVDPDDVTVPPYYVDDPMIRKDWARYLNSWIKTDNEVGQVVERLREEGALDDTVIFFWTDHGVSHLRGKQFLYDEGIRVPLIVHFGSGRDADSVRGNLVEHIDIAATSLALAGIALPPYMHGRDLFSDDYQPRKYAFAARDRCDETVEIIRAVRTKRFKYIRNFLSWLPHAQPNQYKDGKAIVQTMRQMQAGEERDRARLRKELSSERASMRYWAATWLGVLGDPSVASQLEKLTGDETPAVRVAAALALCRLGQHKTYAPVLVDHIDDENLIVGMYAIRALEQIGSDAKPVLPAIRPPAFRVSPALPLWKILPTNHCRC